MREVPKIRLVSTSAADDLGYLGQHAISQAMGNGEEYRIIGGHMVRLLLSAYPTEFATARSTLDADAAVGTVEAVGPLATNLVQQGFVKENANKFVKTVVQGDIDVNVLLPRLSNPSAGLRPVRVEGMGNVDSLPELSWALARNPLVLELDVRLRDSREMTYRVSIPELDVAIVLKTLAWHARRFEKDSDLADLHTLLEIRHAHREAPWSLTDAKLTGFREGTARRLREMSRSLTRRSPGFKVPKELDRVRVAALIQAHVADV